MDKPHPDATDTADALRRSYLNDELPGLLHDLGVQWQAIRAGGYEAGALKELACLTHMIAGGSASFGLPLTAALIRRVDERLRLCARNTPPQAADLEVISADVRALPGVLDREVRGDAGPASPADGGAVPDRSAAAAPPPAAGDRPLIYLVDDDPTQGRYLALQLSAHGFDLKVFRDLDSLRQAVLSRAPAALIADIVFPEGENAGIEAVAALKRITAQPLPVVFASAREDTAARLAALRAGGDAYFTKPVAVADMAARLRDRVNQAPQRPYRVLLVDDDQAVLELHRGMLRGAEFETRGLSDPLRILDVTRDFRPELLLLDLYMPGASGLEIARLLRQEPAFLDLPIVFLSGERDLAKREAAREAGALDFLLKPVSAQHLQSLCRTRAQHYRQQSARSHYLGRVDGVTGLYNRYYFDSLLSERLRQPSKSGIDAVLFLELDDMHRVVDRHPPEPCNLLRARLAQVLGARLAPEDVAAAYSDAAFVLLVNRPDLGGLESLASTLTRTVQDTRVRFRGETLGSGASVGIALAQGDARRVLGEAALACSRARREGGNRVRIQDALLSASTDHDQQQYWSRQIVGALKEKRLFLVFQPLASLAADHTERFEALLRLRDSRGQVVLPGQFMEIAARLNLLRLLDRWVVSNALRLLSQRQQDRGPTIFFIKLSRATLEDKDFGDWLAGMVDKVPVNTYSGVFEIFEADLLESPSSAEALIRRLRDLGFQTAVEHFGVSDEAAQLLERFSPDYVKFDRTLIHRLPESQEKQEQVRTLVQAARNRGIRTAAAYVEDATCLAMLWNYRLDLIQGNLLQQPEAELSYNIDI